ncbi:hypothetical protein ACFLZ8_02510 [Planctomycetota bacterium]
MKRFLMGFMNWLAKRNIKGIVKSQASKFKKTKKINPNISDAIIINKIFESRFDRKLLRATKGEKERITEYIKKNDIPKSLFDLCLAIGEIEFAPRDMEQYFYIHDIMLNELERLGYKVEPQDIS